MNPGLAFDDEQPVLTVDPVCVSHDPEEEARIEADRHRRQIWHGAVEYLLGIQLSSEAIAWSCDCQAFEIECAAEIICEALGFRFRDAELTPSARAALKFVCANWEGQSASDLAYEAGVSDVIVNRQIKRLKNLRIKL